MSLKCDLTGMQLKIRGPKLTFNFFTKFMYALLFSSDPPWDAFDRSEAKVPLMRTPSISSTVVNNSLRGKEISSMLHLKEQY